VSDLSQGAGWWQASDGRWYAPEQHPTYRALVTAATTDVRPPAVIPYDPSTASGNPAWPVADPPPAAETPPATPNRTAGHHAAPTKAATGRRFPGALALIVLGLAIVVGGALWIFRAPPPVSTGGAAQEAQALADALNAGGSAQVCSYVVPAEVTTCRSSGSAALFSQLNFTDMGAGSVTIEGNRALATLTGKICNQSKCTSNHDRTFAQANTYGFDEAWNAASNPENGVPWALALTEVDGQWYVVGY